MAQFLEIKAANPDCMLFYRMGDFYELFFEDAVAAAEALGIVLTKRGKHLGDDIPMCGVPVHRADEYLQRLITKGFRVAVCEQMEDPAEARKRGSKAVVHRDVVRLVTPGTLTEESLLDAKARNYLTALFKGQQGSGGKATVALASLDISTGEFEVGEIPAADFPGEIVRLSPGEVIAADSFLADADLRKWIEIAGAAATPVPAAHFDSLAGERQLKAQLGVADLAGIRVVLAARARRRRRAAQVRRADPARQEALPAPAAPQRTRRRISSSMRRRGRASSCCARLRATRRRACSPPSTAPSPDPAHASWRPGSPAPCAILRLSATGSMRSAFCTRARRCARMSARALRHTPDLARAMSRLALQRGAPKRPRRHSRWTCRGAILRTTAAQRRRRHRLARRRWTISARALRAATTICSRCSPARSSTIRRICGATAISSAPDFPRTWTTPARCATRAAGDGGAGSPIPAGNRHQGAEGPAQQYPGLLHRGAGRRLQADAEPAAQRHLPPSPDHGRRHALHHAGTDRNREPHRVGRRPRARDSSRRSLPSSPPPSPPRNATLGELAAQRWPSSIAWRRWPRSRWSRATSGPLLDDSTTFDIRGGRHPVVEQALKSGQGRRLHRERLRAGGVAPRGADRLRRNDGSAAVAGHRSQHGRQVHLPAPERAHHRAGADGLVRAGALGAHRHRRPAVFARRRRRRPGARPLHFHGRDGGDGRHPQPGHRPLAGHPRRDRPRHGHLRRPLDRLGGGGVPARGQRLPRAVRHALSRADRAGRPSVRRSPTSPWTCASGATRSCFCTR